MRSHELILKYGGSKISRWFMTEDVILIILVNKDNSMINCGRFYEGILL